MKIFFTTIAMSAGLCLAPLANAEITVQMHEVNEKGTTTPIGTVVITESEYGLVFTPHLKEVAPGIHGFHIHEKPSCGAAEQDGVITPAGAAGDHFDPDNAGEHGYPWGTGHLGDLPALYVDAQGNATNPVMSPRLRKLSQVAGRALMIHEGGDNHSDHPEKLGGGGGRIACGLIAP